MSLNDVAGWLGFVCSVIINIPQIFKIWRTKVVDGISIQTYILIFLSCFFYAIPAIDSGLWYFALSNITGMITSATIIAMVCKYGRIQR